MNNFKQQSNKDLLNH